MSGSKLRPGGKKPGLQPIACYKLLVWTRPYSLGPLSGIDEMSADHLMLKLGYESCYHDHSQYLSSYKEVEQYTALICDQF